MPSQHGRALRCAPELAREAIERFLSQAKQPVLMEPGEPQLDLKPGRFELLERSGKLNLQAWNESRNLSRRIAAITRESPGRLELAVERFGGKTGSLELVDASRPQNQVRLRRGGRLEAREWLRRAVERQYPGWECQELTCEPDLENSFSSVFPRAYLERAGEGIAVLGAFAELPGCEGMLSFALLWHDYLRRRESTLQSLSLALFVPRALLRVTCLRLLLLDEQRLRWRVWGVEEDGSETEIDPRDFGNLETQLPVHKTALSSWPEVPGVETIALADGEFSFRVRGLELGRTRGGELRVGLHSKRKGTLEQLQSLALTAGRIRQAGAPDILNPLYTRDPERWLESEVRRQIQELDAALAPPVYGQVPAFAGGERGVIDLLALGEDERLAVIELKAAEDIHLPLQALDYWMRVRWHAERGDFARAGYFPGRQVAALSPKLLLVAPCLQFHPSTDIILRYFSPGIDVERIGVAMDWRRRLRVMFRLSGAETRR